ncbi:MAG: cell division protein ZapA [Acutalibacteraceae bacterium]
MGKEKKVTVSIAGQRFPLITDEREDYILQLANMVDSKMKGISLSNPKLSRDGCATLSALDFCDMLEKERYEHTRCKADNKKLRLELKNAEQSKETLKIELDEAKKKLELLTKENERLRSDASHLIVEQKKRELNPGKTMLSSGRISKGTEKGKKTGEMTSSNSNVAKSEKSDDKEDPRQYSFFKHYL